jgi:hypothetical protein
VKTRIRLHTRKEGGRNLGQQEAHARELRRHEVAHYTQIQWRTLYPCAAVCVCSRSRTLCVHAPPNIRMLVYVCLTWNPCCSIIISSSSTPPLAVSASVCTNDVPLCATVRTDNELEDGTEEQINRSAKTTQRQHNNTKARTREKDHTQGAGAGTGLVKDNTP